MAAIQCCVSYNVRPQQQQKHCLTRQSSVDANANVDAGASKILNQHKSSAKIQQRCQTMQMYAIYALVIVSFASAAMVQSAAASLNVDLLTNPNFKQLCSMQHEHFIESDGKESSVILEFKPGEFAAKKPSCTRILSAPPEYGFIVRLILPKLRHHVGDSGGSNAAASTNSTPEPKHGSSSTISEMSTLIGKLNTTALKSRLGRTCPLSIFSSLDPHTPQWRVDPCQLEDTASEMEDPVRLFHGRVRIVWEHGHHTLKSKLMVTALGKGEQCRGEEKHQCLKIGNEPILCISKDLVCDGIRHCPYSNEYDSDEDYSMCWKHRRLGDPLPTAMESDIFEQFALEVFRNLFAYDAPTAPKEKPNASDVETAAKVTPQNEPTAAAGAAATHHHVPADGQGATALATNSTTTLRKVHTKEMKSNGNENTNIINSINETEPKVENNTESNSGFFGSAGGGGFHRRNSTRNGVHSDLSKYGPWGYLMLGMLLCGGALLICGLWASASQHAVNNEREAALAAAAANGGVGGAGGGLNPSGTTMPPNYEELDPPPAYSVLFPNQKAASSATLNAIVDATPIMASAAASSGNIRHAISATTTTDTASASLAAITASPTSTHVQLEPVAAGSGSQQTTH